MTIFASHGTKMVFLFAASCCLVVWPTAYAFSQSRVVEQSKPANRHELPTALLGAPDDVKAYYRVTDSLMHPTWNTRVNESWSERERHHYAYLLFRANEFDPVAKRKYDFERHAALRGTNTQDVISDREILKMIRDHDSKVLLLLIEIPFWYSVVAEGVDTILYSPIDAKKPTYVPGEVLHARVTKVWKGRAFKVGDQIDGYTLSMWGCQRFQKGGTYILGFCVKEKRDALKGAYLAIGGLYDCSEGFYPIRGGMVSDEENIFGLGSQVRLEGFENALMSNLRTIASWGEVKNK